MKDSPEKISPLRRRMIEDMRLRKLVTKTQDGYIRAVRHFETLRTISADPKHLGARIGTTLVLHTWGSALEFVARIVLLHGNAIARIPIAHRLR